MSTLVGANQSLVVLYHEVVATAVDLLQGSCIVGAIVGEGARPGAEL